MSKDKLTDYDKQVLESYLNRKDTTQTLSDFIIANDDYIRSQVKMMVKMATADDPIYRTVTIYRDDSTVQVVYDRVKSVFWTADNTVLVIARMDKGEDKKHHYIHWPRERFCWFKDQPHES